MLLECDKMVAKWKRILLCWISNDFYCYFTEWERESERERKRGRKKVYKNENGIIINSNSLFRNGKGDKDMGIEARDVRNKKTKQ